MDLDPYPLHISSTPTIFYGCPCGITIRGYFVDPEILTESMRFYRPLPYPYTWYVYGEEAAIVNINDLQAYEETHRYPPSYAYYQPQQQQQQEAIDGGGRRYYSHESIDDVAVLQDLNVDQITNDSFQQASADYVARSGLTKKQISKNLRVTKYHEEESEICAVCQVEFEKDDKVGVLQCKHRFHPKCIKEWLVRKNACPLCKTQGLNV